jgi:hypothetical protein
VAAPAGNPEPAAAATALAGAAVPADATAAPPALSDEPPTAPAFREPDAKIKLLSPNIWVDANPQGRRAIVRARVCLQQGTLEHLMCRSRSKEHEAILSAEIDARMLHAALLFAGARPGGVVQYEPEFKPPHGDEIELVLEWKDAAEYKRARAQEWIHDLRTQKPMPYAWVFAGSREIDNPATGEKYYMAQDGDLVTVVNFVSAVLDVPARSSQSDADHIFEANRSQIPPRGTEVFVICKPVPGKPAANRPDSEKKSDPAGSNSEKPSSAEPTNKT